MMFKDDTEYFADREYLSNSSLKLLRESPVKFKMWLDNKLPKLESPAFDIGHCVHMAILEDKWDFVCEPFANKRTNEGKEFIQNFKEENKGKIVLSHKDYELTMSMIDKLQKVSVVRELVSGGRAEVPSTLTREDGIKLKGKADYYKEFEGTLIDLKTASVDIDSWVNFAYKMLYTQQAQLYKELFQADRFIFLVITKSFPYDIGIFEVGQNGSFADTGRKELDHSLYLYKHLFIENNYQPYEPRIIREI